MRKECLPHPWRRTATGCPNQTGSIKSHVQRHGGRDGERSAQAGGRARGIAHDHGVIPRLTRLHVGEHKRGRVGPAEVSDAITPLVSERRRAGGGDGEGGRRALVHVLTEGLARDARRHRNEVELIHPATILTGHERGVLGVTPFHRLTARSHEEGTLLPVHFTRDARRLEVVGVEDQVVKVQLGGNLPPEDHRAGTGDGGLHGGRPTVGRDRAAGGVHPVMGDDGLSHPTGRAGGPTEVRGLQRLGQRENGNDGEKRIRADRGTDDVGDEQGVGSRLRHLHPGEIQREAGRATDAVAVDQGRAVVEPLVFQRRRAPDSGGEGDGRSRVHPRHRNGLVGDHGDNGGENHFIQEHLVQTIGEQSALRIFPLEYIVALQQIEGFLLPGLIAGDSRPRAAVDVEGKDIDIGFGGSFPPEREGAWAGPPGAQLGGLIAGQGAVARGHEAIVRDVRGPHPPGEALGFPD